MGKLIIDPSSNKYDGSNKYSKSSTVEGVVYKGKTYKEYTYHSTNPRGAGFKLASGLKAFFATISIVGIVFFNRKVMELWNEAITGKRTYRVLISDTSNTLIQPGVIKSGKKFTEEEELRIIKRGLFSDGYDISLLERMIPDINQIIRDEEEQKSIFPNLEHPGYGAVSVAILKNKGYSNIHDEHLKAAIRLMILRGDVVFTDIIRAGNQIVAWDTSAKGAYTKISSSTSDYFDRDKLLCLDEFMKKHQIDLVKLKIKSDDQQLLEKIVNNMNRQFYAWANSRKEAAKYPLDGNRSEIQSILNQFVSKGVIHSYNKSHNNYYIKLYEDDRIPNVVYDYETWKKA